MSLTSANPQCCKATGNTAAPAGLSLLAGIKVIGILKLKLHLGGCADGNVRSADKAGCIRGQEQNWPCKQHKASEGAIPFYHHHFLSLGERFQYDIQRSVDTGQALLATRGALQLPASEVVCIGLYSNGLSSRYVQSERDPDVLHACSIRQMARYPRPPASAPTCAT